MKDSHQDETTKVYDVFSEKYKNQTHDYQIGLRREFQDALPGKKILDLGCAFGRDVKIFRNAFFG